MELFSFDANSPLIGKNPKIQTPLQSLLCYVTFNASSDLKLSVMDNEGYVGAPEALMSAFSSAMNGKLSISLSAKYLGGERPIFTNRLMAEVVEILCSIGSRIRFKWIEDKTNNSVYRAEFKIPISPDGTLPLGQDMILSMDLEGYTNVEFDAINNISYDAVLTVVAQSGVAPAKSHFMMTSFNIPAGNTTSVPLINQNIVAIPADVEKVNLYRNGGSVQELKAANLEVYANLNTSDCIEALGATKNYYKWVVLGAANYREAQITSGTVSYCFGVSVRPL
jgi:hypothetical protein